jgi:hypothetical protein
MLKLFRCYGIYCSCLVQDESVVEGPDQYVGCSGNKVRVWCVVLTDGKGPYGEQKVGEKELKPELGQFVSIFTVELMKPFSYFSSYPVNLGMVCSILTKPMVYLVLVECLATANHWFCGLMHPMCSKHSGRCKC